MYCGLPTIWLVIGKQQHVCLKWVACHLKGDRQMSVHLCMVGCLVWSKRSFCRYGLLGASGCGKTTVLSCVVGRRKLDVGEVRVLGHVPGTPKSGIPGSTVGYMPQEIAVYDGFTITETLHVFGYFHGLTSKQIVERTEELLKSFDLPPASRFIRSLRWEPLFLHILFSFGFIESIFTDFIFNRSNIHRRPASSGLTDFTVNTKHLFPGVLTCFGCETKTGVVRVLDFF